MRQGNKMETSLFGVEAEVIVASDQTAGVKEAWKKWELVSHRPRSTKIPPRFQKAYFKAKEDSTQDQLLNALEAAVVLEPHKNDTLDVGRAATVMTSRKKRALAIARLRSGDQKWLFNDDVIDVSPVSIALHSPIADWSDSDHNVASRMAKMDKEKLDTIYQNVSYFLKKEVIKPTEATKHKDLWEKDRQQLERAARGSRAKVASRARRPKEKNASQLNDSLLQYDAEAMRKYQRGTPLDEVLRFHHRKDINFWHQVQSFVDNEEMDTDDAFRRANNG